MHEPDGYPPANDMVIAAAAGIGGLLTPFCRVNPNNGAPGRGPAGAGRAAHKGIKLHPRAEQFTLDHPAVRDLAAIAHERSLPVLIHAGRGIPALGAHVVELAGAFPNARFILAHAAVCDLAWIWRVAPDHPNLLFDTAWWMPADLQALFSLVPPGQILFASDAPYGHTLMSAVTQMRSALQVGLTPRADPLHRLRAVGADRRRRAVAAGRTGGRASASGPAHAARPGRRVPAARRDRAMRGTDGGPRCSPSPGWPATCQTRSTTRPCSRVIRGLLERLRRSVTRRARRTGAGRGF